MYLAFQFYFQNLNMVIFLILCLGGVYTCISLIITNRCTSILNLSSSMRHGETPKGFFPVHYVWRDDIYVQVYREKNSLASIFLN